MRARFHGTLCRQFPYPSQHSSSSAPIFLRSRSTSSSVRRIGSRRPATLAWRGAIAIATLTTLAAANTPAAAAAVAPSAAQPVFVLGVPVDFILFGLTLIGVAIFHRKTLQVALAGLATIVASCLRQGWPAAVTYRIGFFVMRAIMGWNPDAPHRKRVDLPAPYSTLGGVS